MDYDKTLKNIPTISEDLLKTCRKNHTDHLTSNLRLNEVSTLILFQFYCKINRNQLEIVVEGTYALHPKKYCKILDIIFGGRSLVVRDLGLLSNSRGVDTIFFRERPKIWPRDLRPDFYFSSVLLANQDLK